MIFQLQLHFFGSFMINFWSETCIFRSMIYTDWILFSILWVITYVVQFWSETAIMRAEFNDFPTSSAFFGSFMINFGFETCIFKPLIYTNWILFSILLGHCFAQFRSETAIMGAEFNDFPTSCGFFWPFMINFGSETCTFRSLIYTIWIMFSILLGHYAVQFRSETAIMRAEFNDFPTSSPFFGSFMINFGSETCIFRFMIYTKWILFSILLGHCFAQFRSETAIMRAEFNDFPTSSGFFWPFMINFGSETCTFRSLIYTIWIMFSILLGHFFAQFRCETAIMRAEFNDFSTSSAFFWIFQDQLWVWNM